LWWNLAASDSADSPCVSAALTRLSGLTCPVPEADMKDAAFDPNHNVLFVKLAQIFAIWFLPFHRARVHCVVELHLVPTPSAAHGIDVSFPCTTSDSLPALRNGVSGDGMHGIVGASQSMARTRYMIARQEDHYQVNEFVKFVLPWLGIGPGLVLAWQWWNTLLSIVTAGTASDHTVLF
jgi:hypothetical protein